MSLNLLAILCSPRYQQTSLQLGRMAGSHSSWCPPGLPGPFLQSCFTAVCCPACTGAWGCSFPVAGLHASPYWTSLSSCQPLSPACQGPSGWQRDPLVYRSLFPVLSSAICYVTGGESCLMAMQCPAEVVGAFCAVLLAKAQAEDPSEGNVVAGLVSLFNFRACPLSLQ